MHDVFVLYSHCYVGRGEVFTNKKYSRVYSELSAFDSNIVQEIMYDMVW